MKQYSYSKEHRPNLIVQIGMSMEGNEMLLSFIVIWHNNKQATMRLLDKKIIEDCMDTGLSYVDNHRYIELRFQQIKNTL